MTLDKLLATLSSAIISADLVAVENVFVSLAILFCQRQRDQVFFAAQELTCAKETPEFAERYLNQKHLAASDCRQIKHLRKAKSDVFAVCEWAVHLNEMLELGTLIDDCLKPLELLIETKPPIDIDSLVVNYQLTQLVEIEQRWQQYMTVVQAGADELQTEVVAKWLPPNCLAEFSQRLAQLPGIEQKCQRAKQQLVCALDELTKTKNRLRNKRYHRLSRFIDRPEGQGELSNYLQQRTNNFWLRDRVASLTAIVTGHTPEKKARYDYIYQLSQQIVTYIDTGDSAALIASVMYGRQQFSHRVSSKNSGAYELTLRYQLDQLLEALIRLESPPEITNLGKSP